MVSDPGQSRSPVRPGLDRLLHDPASDPMNTPTEVIEDRNSGFTVRPASDRTVSDGRTHRDQRFTRREDSLNVEEPGLIRRDVVSHFRCRAVSWIPGERLPSSAGQRMRPERAMTLSLGDIMTTQATRTSPIPAELARQVVLPDGHRDDTSLF